MQSLTEMSQQAGPPSAPRPGMSGQAPQPSASPQVMQDQQTQSAKPQRQGKADPEGARRDLSAGIEAVSAALHKNRKTSNALLGMISDQEKVGSVAKAAVQTVTQLAKKTELPKRTLAPLTMYSAMELMDLKEATGGMKFTSEERSQAVIAATELLLTASGVSKEEASALATQAGEKGRKSMETDYKSLLDA